MLDNLEHCDFVRRYNNGTLQKNGIYQLVDFFSLFHYKFGTNRVTDEHYWRNTLGTPEQNNWYGLAFERVCLWHVRQIVRGLRLDAIRHDYYAWRSQKSKPAVQIDLIIDRADGIVTICEMKYSKDDYVLSEGEYKKIISRMETFQKETYNAPQNPDHRLKWFLVLIFFLCSAIWLKFVRPFGQKPFARLNKHRSGKVIRNHNNRIKLIINSVIIKIFLLSLQAKND